MPTREARRTRGDLCIGNLPPAYLDPTLGRSGAFRYRGDYHMTLTNAVQLYALYDQLRTRLTGEPPPPDPQGLDPSDFDGWRRGLILALKFGAPASEVRSGISPDQWAELVEPDPARPPPTPPDPSEFYDDLAPTLPRSAQVDPVLARAGCPWLGHYTLFSTKWSPRAFAGFHEDIALWLLSTVAARRVFVHCGPRHFTNLYIALVARTSVWAKSTTVDIGIATLRAAGLDWLLASDDATPQKFISDLTLTVPRDYDLLDDEAQERARLRLSFAGKRGWLGPSINRPHR